MSSSVHIIHIFMLMCVDVVQYILFTLKDVFDGGFQHSITYSYIHSIAQKGIAFICMYMNTILEDFPFSFSRKIQKKPKKKNNFFIPFQKFSTTHMRIRLHVSVPTLTYVYFILDDWNGAKWVFVWRKDTYKTNRNRKRFQLHTLLISFLSFCHIQNVQIVQFQSGYKAKRE